MLATPAPGLHALRDEDDTPPMAETRYAKSGDVSVAYQVTGDGPIDLVWALGTISHLDLDWDEGNPRKAFIERLGTFARLIRFDKRGTGLSDRPSAVATLEERTDDIRAVMDAAGSERAFLFGLSEGANMACLFAATYPHRVRGLVVWGGQARWVATEDYPWGLTREDQEAEIAVLRERGVTEEYLTGAGAGFPAERVRELQWMLRYMRAGASPSAVAALETMNMDIDTRAILPTINVPTLVMNRTGDPVAHVDAARDLAARIPGARFKEFPGDTHSLMFPDMEPVLAEVQAFVTGERPAPLTERVLATVLFTDIVGSTETAAEVGDAAWSTLLSKHHATVRRELDRHRGKEVDTAGDGFLATFDGPARAIRCALSIRDELGELGIRVRAGVHTGECELADGKVRGIAVHIGARVMSLAEPDEVLVSSTVRDLVAGSGLAFRSRGTHVLKGVPDEWHLYAVTG
jgi:class 3 adenylate cyclase